MFWDRFLLRLYQTFGDVFPTSLAAGETVMTEAYNRGFLDPTTLNDRSRLILILMCRPTTAPHRAAQAAYAGSPLRANPGNTAALVRGLCPPTLQDLLLLHRRGTPAQQGIVANLFRHHFVPPLCDFLSRLYLDDPANRAAQADAQLAKVLPHFDVLARNHPTEFSCYLYRPLLNASNGPLPPSAFPALPYPAWLADLQQNEPEEFNFLRAVHQLPLDMRIHVYLSFYAELSNREIHRVLVSSPGMIRQAVITRLCDSYQRVVQLF